MKRRLTLLAATIWAAAALPAAALDLVMVDRAGCVYCERWKDEIGPIYPKTEVGQAAPLTIVSIGDAPPDGVTFARKVLFTPTFILVDDGQEVGRIEGYPGEDFFWGLLEKMLEDHDPSAAQG